MASNRATHILLSTQHINASSPNGGSWDGGETNYFRVIWEVIGNARISTSMYGVVRHSRPVKREQSPGGPQMFSTGQLTSRRSRREQGGGVCSISEEHNGIYTSEALMSSRRHCRVLLGRYSVVSRGYVDRPVGNQGARRNIDEEELLVSPQKSASNRQDVIGGTVCVCD